jgi:hypothetical protein
MWPFTKSSEDSRDTEGAGSIYGFESKGRRQFAGRDAENAALRELGARLQIPDAVLDHLAVEERRLLLNFILNHHKVISRYQELRARETRLRVLFTALSIALLGALPLLIFFVGSKADGTAAQVTSQLTALITGLVAVQKSLSSWLDKRKVLGNFRRAEADVKSNLYAFEDKWTGKAVTSASGAQQRAEDRRGHALGAEFLLEARAAIAEARRIVEAEESEYFQAVTYPSIDLMGMLRDTGDSARGLVAAHAPFALDRAAQEREAKAVLESGIEQQDATIVRLEAELQARTELIERRRAAMAAASGVEAGLLKAEIDDQQAKLGRLEGELLIARSQVAALRHARSARVPG